MRLWSLHCKYRKPLSGKVWKEWKFFQKNCDCPVCPTQKQKSRGIASALILDFRGYGYACLKRPRLFLKMHRLNWILCFAPKVASLFILYYTGWECVMSTLAIYFWKRDILKRATHFFYKGICWITAICLGLQNALNISDNSSIYNYYGTNRVIIV